jgi:poly-beta-1,6-N-acetyl-D-glucosamine N-deacetylase
MREINSIPKFSINYAAKFMKFGCLNSLVFIASRFVFLCCLFTAAPLAIAQGADSAVVLMYHRFADDKHPTTSLTVEKFAAHVKELKSGAYNIIPLSEFVDALIEKKPLTNRTVIITMDDAYQSVYKHAWPILKKAGLPFTVFVTTHPVDTGQTGYLSWAQLKEMAASGVTISAKTNTLGRLATQDKKHIEWEIRTAADLLRNKLNLKPASFAYPYGQASQATQRAAQSAGYKVAFGQHSGVLHRLTDRFFLPRFSLNDTYGDIGRFRTLINAQPLPVFDVTPQNPLLPATGNPPNFGFTVTAGIAGLDRLACYHSAFGKLALQHLGKSRIEIRFAKPFAAGRSKINCTMPSTGSRWRWFGMQY